MSEARSRYPHGLYPFFIIYYEKSIIYNNINNRPPPKNGGSLRSGEGRLMQLLCEAIG